MGTTLRPRVHLIHQATKVILLVCEMAVMLADHRDARTKDLSQRFGGFPGTKPFDSECVTERVGNQRLDPCLDLQPCEKLFDRPRRPVPSMPAVFTFSLQSGTAEQRSCGMLLHQPLDVCQGFPY